MKHVVCSVLILCALLINSNLLFAQTDVRTAPTTPVSSITFNPVLDTLSSPHAVRDSSDAVTSLGYPIGHSQISWSRFGIATGALAAAIAGLHIYQLNAWWSADRGPFHVQDDPDYKANFDKAGHTFGAYYSSHFFDEAFTWSGFDSLQASALGATFGALWELYVEVEDGFAKTWGFSPGDAKADVGGAALYFATRQIPVLKEFKYKWVYWPSQQFLHSRPDIPGQTLTAIDDYAGQSYWMTVNVHNLLPNSMKSYWPNWLNLAFGITGYNLDVLDTNSLNVFDLRKKAYLISIDYSLEKLIPESSNGIINFIRRGLDYWHFPAPAYRIWPAPKFFILFPFRMTI